MTDLLDQALTRRCPYCYAAPGQGCRTLDTGRPATTHLARITGRRCTCPNCCPARHPRVTRSAESTSPTSDTFPCG